MLRLLRNISQCTTTHIRSTVDDIDHDSSDLSVRGVDLYYKALARSLTTTGEELDDLDHDLSSGSI